MIKSNYKLLKPTCFFIGLLILICNIVAQDLSVYEKRWLLGGTDTLLPFRLLLPVTYKDSSNKERKYPLILFLHGAGERGIDNEIQLTHGAKLFLQDDVRNTYPAIIVFPQCPPNSYWSNVKMKNVDGKTELYFPINGKPTKAMEWLHGLIAVLQQNYAVDESRIYVGGIAMGGMGTFEIVSRNPHLFAAAFPISGGADPKTAGRLKKTAWWIFHGAEDNVIPPIHSTVMVDALKNKRAAVRYTLYPDANHNSWQQAFAEMDLFSWLFNNRRESLYGYSLPL